MSDDSEPVSPVLKREALLPMERSRGLGTVAVVCTMAGVASGLALATTLMAMQVADSMATRSCPYAERIEIRSVDTRQEQGFLGILPSFRGGVAEVERVVAGTPAEAVALQVGDHILSIDGESIDKPNEVQALIAGMSPGSRPMILIERDGTHRTIRPTLISRSFLSD